MKDKLNIIKKNEPWFKEGLRFKCTGCGECCTGAPGAVWVSEEEIQLFAEHFKISRETFIEQYTKNIDGKLSLKDHPINFDCVFLKDKKCTVYKLRPSQCRTYPWWPKILESKNDWENAAKWCEGINHKDAPIVSFEEITAAQENLEI